MAPNLVVTKEQLDHLTNVIIKKIHGNVKLSQETIDKIREGIDLSPIIKAVLNSLPIPKDGINGAKGEDGKDAVITEEIISSIAVKAIEQLQEIFKPPKDGRDGRSGIKGDPGQKGDKGETGRDAVFSENILSNITARTLERVKPLIEKGDKGEPGKDGETGIQGETGKDGQDGIFTDDDIQKVIDSLDFSDNATNNDIDKAIKTLVRKLQNDIIELPYSKGGIDIKLLINDISKSLGTSEWKNQDAYISNAGTKIGKIGNENYTLDPDGNIVVTSTVDELNERINTLIKIVSNPNFDSIDINDAVKTYLSGQIHFDPSQVTHIFDTAISGVRLNAGQEEYFLVYNDTAEIISNGKVCYASGVNVANNILTVGLADNSSFLTSAQVLGLATHNIGINQIGLVTWRGRVNDWDTTDTGFGLSYLGIEGKLTNIKPLYPATRIAMGALIKLHATEGVFQTAISALPRRSASRSYGFTSADAAAGKHWKAGFYDWAAAGAALNQGSLTVNHGAANISRAAHVGIVPNGPGVVDTGQVGLQVTGTLDSEGSGQIASQTAIITDDITTLSLNVMEETLEKFSGAVVISLYVVSGTPTAYSLTFNYGYSKYEDFRNIDGTVTAFSAVWEGGQADTVFDVSLKFHNAIGWTYAATGFEPGNGDICNRLTDQGIDSNVALGVDGAYKRTNLNQFVTGTLKEGVIIEIITGGTKTIRSMDLHISAFSEELF